MVSLPIISRSVRQTKVIAGRMAREILRDGGPHVIGLYGNLGSGKTVFAQGFARTLGIKENVSSPTFVLLKIYKLPKPRKFKYLIHVDCYRLYSPKDILHLVIKDFLRNSDTIILVEWADRLGKLMSQDSIRVSFNYGGISSERIIKVKRPFVRSRTSHISHR